MTDFFVATLALHENERIDRNALRRVPSPSLYKLSTAPIQIAASYSLLITPQDNESTGTKSTWQR